jgi:WD40 repeat protein
VWNVETGAQLMAIGGHSDSVHAIAVHPNGQSIASGGRDLSVRLWDLSFESAASP